jgi:hypothetical protein
MKSMENFMSIGNNLLKGRRQRRHQTKLPRSKIKEEDLLLRRNNSKEFVVIVENKDTRALPVGRRRGKIPTTATVRVMTTTTEVAGTKAKLNVLDGEKWLGDDALECTNKTMQTAMRCQIFLSGTSTTKKNRKK